MDRPPALRRIQHVSLVRPRESDVAARHFYGAVLGLNEIPVPASLAAYDLIWYRLGDDELHLVGRETQPGEAGQHLCIEVDEVAALRDYLTAAGVPITDDPEIPNRPRFFCRDPFGNAIEFTSILGPYT